MQTSKLQKRALSSQIPCMQASKNPLVRIPTIFRCPSLLSCPPPPSKHTTQRHELTTSSPAPASQACTRPACIPFRASFTWTHNFSLFTRICFRRRRRRSLALLVAAAESRVVPRRPPRSHGHVRRKLGHLGYICQAPCQGTCLSISTTWIRGF